MSPSTEAPASLPVPGMENSPCRPLASGVSPLMRALDLWVATRLITSFACSLANASDARAIPIKGVTLEEPRLRPFHESSDVDLLIGPRQMERLTTLLHEPGWPSRGTSSGARRITQHSCEWQHEDWPSVIDVHSEFPGLLVGREEAFEVLWRDPERVTVAGQQVWIPRRASSIVIWALHSLRGRATQARHVDE